MAPKNDQLILSLLQDLTSEVKEIRQKDIPALQVHQAALDQKVMDETKFQARSYAWLYGGISTVIALTSVAVAYFRK